MSRMLAAKGRRTVTHQGVLIIRGVYKVSLWVHVSSEMFEKTVDLHRDRNRHQGV